MAEGAEGRWQVADIETVARAGFTAILAMNPSFAVAVKYRAQEATGMRVLSNKQTAPGEFGQAGTTVSTVRVRSDQIDEPDRGAHITVGGLPSMTGFQNPVNWISSLLHTTNARARLSGNKES